MIIESMPSDYYSVQAARVTKRIATLSGKPTPPRQLEEVRSAGELHRAGSYRHPGDNKDFNLPDADMKMIGLDGVGDDFQGHVRQLWARTEIRLERQPFPFMNEFRDVFIDKNGAIWTAEGRDIKSARQMQGRITDSTQVPNFDEAYTCLGGQCRIL
ncbi:hypothetical protein FPV16_24515 [Methylobacterium sp. W2]|uniref:hypothetical protein n=1 Tax=Methylobacterium sp. W2 TaxID=2598107 RepID=UPI001D0C8079|nr:hypothetical protein [Methylobacterium sp. W2]MCC0809322.1 hypothetical protein [Methylobacterium sp. W2]